MFSDKGASFEFSSLPVPPAPLVLSFLERRLEKRRRRAALLFYLIRFLVGAQGKSSRTL